MAIEFHCEHCGKTIRAADEHGGKHGKCPSCHQRVYVPTAEIEPLELAPIDSADEARARRAAQESQQFADALLSERAPAGEPAGPAKPGGSPARPSGPARPPATPAAPNLTPAEVADLVNEYAIAMFEGELEEGQQIAARLRKVPRLVDDAVQRITSDEIPPSALEHIPRPVLTAFLKQIRGA